MGSIVALSNGSCRPLYQDTAITVLSRNLVIGLAAPHRFRAVYSTGYFVAAGGLMSYGNGPPSRHVSASGVLRRPASCSGDKPADLPVQVPTKYELVINLKTAKALGLEVAPALLARADEVIE